MIAGAPISPTPVVSRRSRTGLAVMLMSSALLGMSGTAVARVLPLPAGHRSTEAHVAVDPTDSHDVLVLARDEDRGRLVGLRAWRSRDGGRSFRSWMLVDRRLAGTPADASDPVALFDHAGRPAPAFLALRYREATWESRIMLGDRIVVRDEHPPPFPTLGEGFGTRRWHDKPWATIDPRDGLAHATWTMRSATETEPIEQIAVASAPPGQPFPPPLVLGAGNAAQPVIGPGSSLIVVWYRRPNLSQRAQILSARSLDRGASWSAPHVIATGVPARGDPPFPTVARAGAGFAACWQEQPAGRRGHIACSRSPDGASWTRPHTVAQPPGAGAATQPALAAAPSGRLWLAFYRFDRRSTSVELWSSRSSAKSWRRRKVLMRRPVPRSGSYFLGDYQGLAATRSHVIAAFTMPVRSHAFRQEVEVARYATR